MNKIKGVLIEHSLWNLRKTHETFTSNQVDLIANVESF